LLPFALLSRLDFPRASLLFLLLQIAALALVAWLLARATRVSIVATASALLLGGAIAIFNGQPFPFALAALCAAAFAARNGSYISASVFAAGAAIEPHLALPAIVSLAYALPRTRIPLTLAIATLALASVATLGIATNLEYFTRVLPAHALSEAASGNQYSLTTVLIHLGTPIERALHVADVQYAIFSIVGILVATKLARTCAAPEFIVLIPPLFASLGGPFIHQTQTTIAIPALFALAARIPRYRVPFGFALLFVAIPWPDASDINPIAGACAIAIAAVPIAFTLFRPDFRTIFLAIVALFAVDYGLRAYRAHYPTTAYRPGAAIAAVAGPDRLAEDTWAAYETVKETRDADIKLPVRAPTWFALGAAIATTLVAVARRPGASPRSSRRSHEARV
jgi:hypothetical protein